MGEIQGGGMRIIETALDHNVEDGALLLHTSDALMAAGIVRLSVLNMSGGPASFEYVFFDVDATPDEEQAELIRRAEHSDRIVIGITRT